MKKTKRSTDHAQQLARIILDYDEQCPGEPESAMEVDFETWAKLIDLAGEIEDPGSD